jgi:hypothetical protein
METINFYVLRWGTKYDANWVNRMYYLLQKNVTLPFTFTCYTDSDDSYDYEEIKIMKIPASDKYLEAWWHKFGLLKYTTTKNNVFFDLDLYFTRNLDELLLDWVKRFEKNKKLLIAQYIRREQHAVVYEYPNSSILVWQYNINLFYDEMMKNQFVTMSSHKGIDSFIRINYMHEVDVLEDSFGRIVYNDLSTTYELVVGDYVDRCMFYIDKKRHVLSFNGIFINSKNLEIYKNTNIQQDIKEFLNGVFEYVLKDFDFNEYNKRIGINIKTGTDFAKIPYKRS